MWWYLREKKVTMGIDCKQLRDEIIVPSLITLNMLSDSAVYLLLGTAAQESGMGTYIRQIQGPAVGIFQMEPTTYFSLWNTMKIPLRQKIMSYLNYAEEPDASFMVHDLGFAAIMCRLKYASITAPLPVNEVSQLAHYWKVYYNTNAGRGTEYEFIANYRKYVTC